MSPIDPWYFGGYLLVLAAIRLGFAVGHGATYLRFARKLRRFPALPVARAGAMLAYASIALPLAGVACTLVICVGAWRELPPYSIRLVFDLTAVTLLYMVLELAPAAVLLATLAVLAVVAQRRTR